MIAKKYDILAIGAPFIDLILHVSEEFLATIPGEKKGMEPTDHNSLLKIIQASQQTPFIIPGGSGANTIKGLTNLGHTCAIVGKIGTDDLGRLFEQEITNLGVQSLFLPTNTPTGQSLCLVTPNGERTMRSFLGASQEMTAVDLKPEFFRGVKLVHIEGHSLLNGSLAVRAMELAKEVGAKISFDLGSFEIVSLYKETILSLLERYVDIVFCNREEAEHLTGKSPEEACRELKEICLVAVVLMGKEGCWVGDRSKNGCAEENGNGKRKDVFQCPAYPVTPIDTTGAGDLFASGFLHGFFNGEPLKECARYGALLGAAVVQVQGTKIPTDIWAQLKQKIVSSSSS